MRLVIILITTSMLLSACSSKTPTHVYDPDVLNKVSLGMSRPQVEALLGKPFNLQERYSTEPSYKGVEIIALYSPKLRALEQKIAQDMQDNQDIDATTGVLSGALSILGSVVPSAGIGSSVGNTAIGMAGGLAKTELDRSALDPNLIESAEVLYRDDKIQSITRRNLSSGPR